jgi:membrane-bound serine protease (ClpP class)
MTHGALLSPRFLARGSLLRFLVLALLLLWPLAAAAADRPTDGLIVQVPTVITSESNKRLQSLLYGPLKRFEAGAARQEGRFTLVCDFNPDGRRSLCDNFGACYELATYLRSLPANFKGVTTVAYIHAQVKRHSVLPVLACSEIVFSEKGQLGEVSTAGGKALSRVEKTAYEEIIRGRISSPALVRKMYEPNLEVIQAGDRFAAGDEKPRPRGEPVAELSGNETALYSFALARKVGLAQQLPSATLEDVRVAYSLPRSGMKRSLDRTICWRIPVEGAITGELVEQTQRRIGRALRAGANLLILDLKCAGGSGDKAYELGLYLATLNEKRPDNPVETVAFVTNKARNLAAFVAFGCNKIVMQREEGEEPEDEDGLPREARLGGFDLFLRKDASLLPIQKELEEIDRRGGGAPRKADLQMKLAAAEKELSATLRENLIDLANRQLYPAVLAAGMFSPELRIYRVERAVGASGQAFLSEEDFKADQQGPKQWRSVGLVKPWQGEAKYDNHPLTLTARQALDLGVAQAVVKDLNELYEVEGVVPNEVHTPSADWLDGLADFFRHPWTSVALVMLGITCLILELKMPGVGLPGVIAAICFVLFFWSHSQLHGQITWLAILLFVLGLVLIALEVFVLPGFGVAGISGTLLVLASLGLVAYGHWPRSSDEWVVFGNKLAPFSVSLLGSLALVFLVAKYLPHIPILNRLMLKTAEENEEGAAAPDIPMHAELMALLGAIGIAATPLRPAGKTQFGDSFIDVVAEGGYIMPGTRVQVVEVEGNRVVVKEV